MLDTVDECTVHSLKEFDGKLIFTTKVALDPVDEDEKTKRGKAESRVQSSEHGHEECPRLQGLQEIVSDTEDVCGVCVCCQFAGISACFDMCTSIRP